jgi:translation initiation factor 4G
MSLLNKLCPENQEKILQRLVALEIDSADDLKTVISVLFQKALCDPHYCETFADVVFELSSRYPEFPSATQLDDQPTSFASLLESSCQHELGVVLKGVEATSPNNIEQSDDVDRRRSMDSAYMKFVGHLFIRRLISPGIVGKILHQLLAPDAASAACVECACTLLHAIGHTLDAAPRGKEQINLVFLRLRDLKASGGPPHQPWSSKLPQFKIQDLLDLRANGWKMKKFAESAKTKKNLLWADDSPYELVVAGSLPECMTPSSKEIYKCRPRQDTS